MFIRKTPTRLNFFSKYPLLATLILFLLTAWRPTTATADDVAVFDFTDKDFASAQGLNAGSNITSPLTVGDITLTFTKVGKFSPGYSADPRVASLYAQNTLTVSSAGKPIKSIEFTVYTDGGNAKSPTATNFSATPGELTYSTTTCTWSGETTSVTFKNIAKASARICLQSVKVYTEEQTSTKKTPELMFSSTSATTTVNATSVDITLSGIPDGATVSYASSATNIATVSSDGTITPIAPGTVTISATTSSTDDYLQGVAECSLTVTPKSETTESLENLYAKVTSQADIVDGGIYLVVCEKTDTPLAMSTFDTSSTKKRAAVGITTSNDRTTTAVNQSEKPYEITLKSVEGVSNTYYMIPSNGKYLYNANQSNLQEKDISALVNKEKYKVRWHIQYKQDGTVSISNDSYKTKYYILYNASSKFFSAYEGDGASPNTSDITLYRRLGQVSINTAEGFATLYTDCAFTMPEGLQGTTVTGVDANGLLTTDWEYQPGDTVPAYTGLLLSGTYGETYTYSFVNTTLENSVNCLAGTLTNETPDEDDASNFYYLTYSKVDGTKTLGFYFWNEDGTPGKNSAGHAYLKLPKTVSSTKGFALVGSDATAIHHVETSVDRPQAIYTLSGLRINATDVNALPAGLYIVNGKKVLVR